MPLPSEQNRPMKFAVRKAITRFAMGICHLPATATRRLELSTTLTLYLVLTGLTPTLIESTEAKPRTSITNARLWAHPDHTRFVLEMTSDISPKVFLLSDPNRLVIDFPEVDFAIPRVQTQPRGAVGVIAGYRYGLLKAGVSRLVLDLAMPCTIKRKFVLPPLEGKPYRFVIDLQPSTESAFRATVATNAIRPTVQSERIPTTNLPPSPIDDVFTIAIDAGHGGVDPGAIGRNGVYEKDVALAAAIELATAIERIGGYQVVLTRTKDIFLPLRQRVAIGRHAGADLFLSLHADSINDMKVKGAHVYSLSDNASDKEAEALATKENKADIIAGIDLAAHPPDVSSILLDLSQRETNNFSADVANVLVATWKAHGLKLLRKPHRQAGFAVLKAPDVPSILVELGFLSNASDVKELSSTSGRAALLRSLAQAVDRYFKTAIPGR